jgi:hypothetical protein
MRPRSETALIRSARAESLFGEVEKGGVWGEKRCDNLGLSVYQGMANMHQRLIVGTPTVGSITRLQARRAVQTVKIAKSKAKVARNGTSSANGQAVHPSIVERYLGHFGSSPAPRKKGSIVMKRRATKPTAKKLTPR